MLKGEEKSCGKSMKYSELDKQNKIVAKENWKGKYECIPR